MKLTIQAAKQFDFVGDEPMREEDVTIEVEIRDGDYEQVPVRLSNDRGAVYYVEVAEFLRLLRAVVIAREEGR